MKLRHFPNTRLRRELHPHAICATAIVAICAVSWLGFFSIKTQTRDNLQKSLETVLESTSEAVVYWITTQKITDETWARNSTINQIADELLQVSPDRATLSHNAHQDALRRFFHPVTESPAYDGYFIVDKNNVNIASSRDENLGEINLLTRMPKALEAAWRGRTVISPPVMSDVPLPDRMGVLQPDRVTMFALTPLRDEQERVKALLLLRLNPLHTFTSIFLPGRLGKTGETYAIDQTGYLVSESRFDEHLTSAGLIKPTESPVMKIRIADPGRNLVTRPVRQGEQEGLPLTLMARRLTKERAPGHQIDGYRDYRGVVVVGAWSWMDDLDIGVTTEIDYSEAYAGLRLPGYFITGSAATLIVLSLVLLKLYLAMQTQTRLARESAHDAVGADRMKTEFLSTMSHEIRTPMNGVLGMLSLLRAGDLPEKARRRVDIAYQSAEGLLRLLNDILDYSRLESSKIDLESTAYSPLQVIERVAEIMAPEAQSRGIELTCSVAADLPDRVVGDPDRVRQILINLVHNGIKFTKQGSVTLTLSAVPGEKDQDDVLSFEVADTGIGIPEAALSEIFDRFQQADRSTTRLYGGTGLGLAICKQLTELMGGSIAVESTPGEGSRFTLTLPIIRADQSVDPGPLDKEPGPAHPSEEDSRRA